MWQAKTESSVKNHSWFKTVLIRVINVTLKIRQNIEEIKSILKRIDNLLIYTEYKYLYLKQLSKYISKNYR
jgi:hypothetical protein